ncbi:hypothetical protein FXO38_25506 [Capsicum annuum]|nr:hypothetical protein FXO38_25506 [Capsicum annuum]
MSSMKTMMYMSMYYLNTRFIRYMKDAGALPWKWYPAKSGDWMELMIDGSEPVGTHPYLSEKLPDSPESDGLACHTRSTHNFPFYGHPDGVYHISDKEDCTCTANTDLGHKAWGSIPIIVSKFMYWGTG